MHVKCAMMQLCISKAICTEVYGEPWIVDAAPQVMI